MEIVFSSTTALAAAIRSRQVSAVDVLEAHLAQIDQHNPALNAVVTLDAEHARQRAREADAALAKGEVWGALHGVPFTLKDTFATAGMRTTTGAPFLDHVPQTDSTVAARLKAAGGILIGKTNVATMLGDFQTSNPIFGRTNNPWDISRTPGGSSGGAAAALAAGMTPFEIGTDLSGSVRLPAHFCGVFGFKPTENQVSLDGVIPGLPPQRSVRIMSCVGALARTADDLELIYGIIAGPDNRDTDVRPMAIEPQPALKIDQLRLAFAPTFPGLPISAAVGGAVESLANALRQAGAVVEEAELPQINFGQQLEQAGELIGMMVGAFQPESGQAPTTLAQYFEALYQRDQAIIAWEQFFDEWDALLCPAAMTTAFPHCEAGTPLDVDGQSASYWAVSAHTTLFNYTGHPAVVMPYQQDQHGLPIGVQLVGKRWQDLRLLAIAKAVSAITGDFQRPPRY